MESTNPQNDPRTALTHAQTGLDYSSANELIPADAQRTKLLEYAVSQRLAAVNAGQPEIITLERAAQAARERYSAVAPLRYSLDPEQMAIERRARTAMRRARPAYRKAYRAWERAEREEQADRQELSYPNFM